jgi:hypothetical protein
MGLKRFQLQRFGSRWHNNGHDFRPGRGWKSGVETPARGIKLGVRTAGFNNPAGWATARSTGAVNLLEPADAFNIPVPEWN